MKPWDRPELTRLRRSQPEDELIRKAAKSMRRNVLWITTEEMDLAMRRGLGMQAREAFHVGRGNRRG